MSKEYVILNRVNVLALDKHTFIPSWMSLKVILILVVFESSEYVFTAIWRLLRAILASPSHISANHSMDASSIDL